MAYLSLTRLRLRAWYYVPAFLLHTVRSSRQARRSNGFIAGALSADPRRLTFWTATLWTEQAAMRAYQLTGAHRKAMPKLGFWCDEAAVAQREEAAQELPGAGDALLHMRQHGRTSRLPHPSPAHAAGETVPDGRAPHFASPLRPIRTE